MDDVVTVHGPVVPVVPGVSGLIYEITMPSGMIITSPQGFGSPATAFRPSGHIWVTDDGRVIAAPEEPETEYSEYDRFNGLVTGILAVPNAEVEATL